MRLVTFNNLYHSTYISSVELKEGNAASVSRIIEVELKQDV